MGRLTLCLDSSVVIDLTRRRSPASRDRLREAVERGDELVTSAVVLYELLAGAHLSSDPKREQDRLDQALAGIDVVDLTPEDVVVTGRVGGLLRSRGRSIGDIDTLIAGHALARGWTVVTSNVRHFGRVEGLTLIDWAVGPDPLSPDAIALKVDAAV